MNQLKQRIQQLDDDIEDLIYIDGDPIVIRRATSEEESIGEFTEINTKNENAVYIVRNGIMVEAPAPDNGYGALTINWQGGKPCHGKMEQSFKL